MFSTLPDAEGLPLGFQHGRPEPHFFMVMRHPDSWRRLLYLPILPVHFRRCRVDSVTADKKLYLDGGGDIKDKRVAGSAFLTI
jgi:hypothetical protein